MPVTVFVDPADPTTARLDGVMRWVDLVFVTVWFVAAAGILTASAIARRRHPPSPMTSARW